MTWDEYAKRIKLTDLSLLEKWKRQYPDGPDSAPDSFFDSLGRDRTGNKTGHTNTNIDVTTKVDDLGGTGIGNNPDVIPEDRQLWLDFIAPANQSFQDVLNMGGINTGKEDAITAGTQAATERLMERLGAQGTTSSGMATALQRSIELGGVGMTAQSRGQEIDSARRGLSGLSSVYASLLHQQSPIAPFGGGWMRGPTAYNPETEQYEPYSTPGDHPQWDPYAEE